MDPFSGDICLEHHEIRRAGIAMSTLYGDGDTLAWVTYAQLGTRLFYLYP